MDKNKRKSIRQAKIKSGVCIDCTHPVMPGKWRCRKHYFEHKSLCARHYRKASGYSDLTLTKQLKAQPVSRMSDLVGNLI